MDVTVTELRRSSRKVRALAQETPVVVTSRGKPEFVLMSADHYEALRALQRHPFRVDLAPDHVLEALSKARMDAGHAHLDELMDAGAAEFDQLLDQVQRIIDESGDPAGFDAKAWLTDWLDRPLPALGGAKPRELMTTVDGRQFVSKTIAQMQSGAYA
jgi:prevent-host-death family protein